MHSGTRGATQITGIRNTGRQSKSSVEFALRTKGAHRKWSVRVADQFITSHPADEIYEGGYNGKWTYAQGVFLEGLQQLWLSTRKPRYLRYIKSNIDMFIGGDGSIRTYNYCDFNVENINTGRQLLFLYTLTGDKKYKSAADTLRKQLKNQPGIISNSTSSEACPFQMRLEGLYMAEPFFTQYSKIFRERRNFGDIAQQILLMEKKTRNEETGLLSDAWDKSLNERLSDTKAGNSLNYFTRIMGSYAMAVADVLDYFPKNHTKRCELIRSLRKLSEAMMKVRDRNCHLWYRLADKAGGKDNPHEFTASCMLAYAFAKGANRGYLDQKYLKFAKEIFYGVVNNFDAAKESVPKDSQQSFTIRDAAGEPFSGVGSFRYKIDELQKSASLEALGSFLLLTLELEKGKVL